MRLVVTGYRDWSVPRAVFEMLDDCLPGPDRRMHLVGVGDCPTGADAAVSVWCRTEGVPVQRFHADWNAFGKAAGPMRNKAMVDQIHPELVLAFLHPKSKGTWQCAQYARSRGIRVLEIWEGR